MNVCTVFIFSAFLAVSYSQLLEDIPADFEPVLSKMVADTQSKVKIAKAKNGLEVEGHKAIARVIRHTNPESRIARTVIIENTPEALRAFGVKNIPKRFAKRSKNTKQKRFCLT